jgi:hypothetical protein
MDSLVYFVSVIALLLAALCTSGLPGVSFFLNGKTDFLSTVLRSTKAARVELRKNAPLKSARVTATAQELEFRNVSAVAAEEDDDEDNGNGHSMRWNSFVNGKLQSLAGKKPSGLPGIGPKYATTWASKGYKTALDVFAAYLRYGPKRFAQIAADDIGMNSKTVQDLVSAVEARWSSLSLVGSKKQDLQRNNEAEGDHSIRWGVFVNCKLSEAELKDLPGVGKTTLDKLYKYGITSPVQMLGEFVARGRENFEAFCEKEFDIRKIGKNDNLNEVGSALEAKWNALTLYGS